MRYKIASHLQLPAGYARSYFSADIRRSAIAEGFPEGHS